MTGRDRSRSGRARGPASAWVLCVCLLAVVPLCAAGCGGLAAAAEPSDGPSLLEADAGWEAGQSYGFLPGGTLGPMLVGVSGSAARLKWLADASQEGVSLGAADSTLSVTLVDPETGARVATVRFRGAGGSGSVDLPLSDGERTFYKLAFRAQGAYRWCSLLFETRE